MNGTKVWWQSKAVWGSLIALLAGFGTLAGLNRQYFTVYQFKRMHRFADLLPIAPADLADRVETLLAAPLPEAFALLYALEGEVLALVAEHAPQIDLTAVHERRTRWVVPTAAARAASPRSAPTPTEDET